MAHERNKHELTWTLRDNGNIDTYRALVQNVSNDASSIPGALDAVDARKLQLAGF